MCNRDKTKIERMLYEIAFIEKLTCNMTMEQFLVDDVAQHSVTMSLITIGECANHLSEVYIDAHFDIEWHKIIAVRNIAAHGYWQLNMKQIWQAIITDIPKLKKCIEETV